MLDEPQDAWAVVPTLNKFERDLAEQIAAFVTGERTITIQKAKGRNHKIQCTKRQKPEIERLYSSLREVFNKELDSTVLAFFQAYGLFPPAEENEGERPPVTDEMVFRWKKAQRRSQQIERVNLHHQLEEKNGE